LEILTKSELSLILREPFSGRAFLGEFLFLGEGGKSFSFLVFLRAGLGWPKMGCSSKDGWPKKGLGDLSLNPIYTSTYLITFLLSSS
jgi:hypothetical protein